MNNQIKHAGKFEFNILKSGVLKLVHSFEKEILGEIMMEEFDPPIEIPPRTKVIITCDKKLEGMVAVLTIKY